MYKWKIFEKMFEIFFAYCSGDNTERRNSSAGASRYETPSYSLVGVHNVQ